MAVLLGFRPIVSMIDVHNYAKNGTMQNYHQHKDISMFIIMNHYLKLYGDDYSGKGSTNNSI